ncbi:MAG: hypothetical protein K6T80_07835, partial [Firmicutes bacterium]|nr:hypothetical protein [Bacillota bacterium]
SDIVAGGKTVIITLAGGTWAADAASSATKRNALIDGFAASSDLAAWNLVKAALKANPGSVVRSSDTVMTITLPPVPAYEIIADQTVQLTIPKALLGQLSVDVPVATPLTVTIPVYNVRGTLEESLGNGSLAGYLETIPLQQIYIIVPKKYINTIEIGYTALGNSTVTSIDVVAEPEVASVKAAAGGTERTAAAFTPYNGKRKYNLGFAGLDPTKEITISAFDSGGNKLQGDITKKITGGKKSYAEAPATSLAGSYKMYRLVTDSTLLKNILKYYPLADLTVSTP